MIDILDYNREELENFVVNELGEPKFRAAQLWQWLWKKMARDFDSMTNLAKVLRGKLAETAEILWPEIEVVSTSKDGTIKFLLKLRDGAQIETVLIPGDGRYTQCLSTQVGCAMGCTFCSTGQMGFERNMTMSEILGQILVGRHYLSEHNLNELKNVVFMGMGEPLMNLKTMLKTMRAMNDDNGLSFSPRRITLSTVGFPKQLQTLGESDLCFPAISLHAPTQELRAKIMPKAAEVHLDDLMAALDRYPLKPRGRITYEYLLLGGVNDSIEHAKQLVKLLGQRKCKVNLIAYNPGDKPLYKKPSEKDILAFEKYLWSKNITTILRKSMGQDIQAACGQLKAENQKK
ncbi:23S rRNA (adenine(2503)-C(2))-methyltransferase RlmN [Maridesulfovibrio bastinii]|jgi:23S rRNA (adenine2503-C2)-methyltransferase|uniref:23S rRNA (adenine(2503)-C(2))-methyltransferase RlmN n=1 Tax=Maridesulfovibrio bastinii TaxID=47157 RepID=UPI000409F6DC|nr:23S rRNA (adenine(2503)-C(2))-methyltransferase RlmN [Maridesulfovibrio bastinii]